MFETSPQEMDAGAGWPSTFRGGRWPIVVFLLAFSIWVTISNALYARLLGPDPTVVSEHLFGIASTTVQMGLAVLVLRYEGGGLRNLGLSPRLLVPAVVSVAGVVVVLNAAVAGLVVAGGGELSFGFFAYLQAPPYDLSPTAIALSSVHYYLFVGPAEEVAFRGYLQNKVVALLGFGRERLRTALGVVTAGVAFSLLHVPTILVLGGGRIQGAVGTLVLLSLTGIAFGTIYALTRNLYLVALLHGIGDLWPLFVETGSVAWPNWGVVLVCYALLVLLYRRWATGAPKSTRARTA